MTEDVYQKLQQQIPSFSKSQKRIAQLILQKREQVAFDTAASLAKQADTSESTVVRFATQMGYEGFPQMQKALQEGLLHRLTADRQIPLQKQGVSFLQEDIQALETTQWALEAETLTGFAQTLLQANCVYILGSGDMAAPAIYFCRHLYDVRPGVHICTHTGEQQVLGELKHITDKDAVFILQDRVCREVAAIAASFVHSAGGTVLTITDRENETSGKTADLCLQVYAPEERDVGSLTACMSLCWRLLVEIKRIRGYP